jgi:hypothetical protein
MGPTVVESPQQVGTPRARRYGIGTSIRYRAGGADGWREGKMQNISISGVLLCTDQPLEVDTAIEMRFVLPVELLNGESAAEVLCRGVVVRSSAVSGPEGEANVAARIISSRFLRQPTRK